MGYGKKRYFIVAEPIVKFIEDFCRYNGVTEGPLFQHGPKKNPLTTDAVWKQLQPVTQYLGYRHVSTHSFRKKFALDLYDHSGHDIDLVRTALQHSSVTTTQVYLKRSDAQVEAALLANVSIA